MIDVLRNKSVDGRCLRRSLGHLELIKRPDLDGVDLHGSLVGVGVVPGGVPGTLGIVEGVDGSGVHVRPCLAALAIREVAIGATDGHVHEQVELLVEGGVQVSLVSPRVVTAAPATSLPEALAGSVDVENDV